ncbi:MAG: DNA-binding Lrp family transcriptional regulator [Polaribacter sp.]|jgi:DNA-binding Lrp family transcriptional regulator
MYVQAQNNYQKALDYRQPVFKGELRDNKVITAEVAIVSPKSLGQAMIFIISVGLRRDNVDRFNLFKPNVMKSNRIQQCYYVTGEADFILIVTAKDMADFEDFTKRLLQIVMFYILKHRL